MKGKYFLVTVLDKLNNTTRTWKTYSISVDEIKRTLEPMKDFKFIKAEVVNNE